MTPPTGSVDEARRRRFEDAWRRDGPQPVEPFLPPAGDPAYLPTLAELVLIAREFAWKACAQGRADAPPPVEEVVQRFPGLGDTVYLDQLRAQDSEFRHQRSTVAAPPGGPGGAAASASETAPAAGGDAADGWPDLPGYQVLGRLGRGGMGVVYQARHLALNRLVAVKMLRDPGDDSPEAAARFRAEAEAVARLRHPNIVQVYEVGEHAGRPYFTLEYVAGGSLDRLIAGAPQPPGPAARLVAQLARAVQYAHRQGIVHRDLKPANVLLEAPEDGGERTDCQKTDDRPPEDTGAGHSPSSPSTAPCLLSSCQAKVTDFGLAKRLESVGQTKTGDVLGTPCYMAPEQARGFPEEVGPAADVYALGAILYELLTGRPPFRGVTAWATIRLVLGTDPVPPRRLQPGVPRDLETVCLKCLEKDPARRYASADALADDLERLLADRPILARPAGRAERLLRLGRRNPVVAGLAAALLAVVAAALVGLTGLWLRAERLRVGAEASAGEARRQRDRADANFRKARDAVDQLLARVGAERLTDVPQLEQVRRTILEDVLTYYRGFRAERSDDPAVRYETGRAYRRVGDIYTLLGEYARAEEHYRGALDLLEPLARDFPAGSEYRRELGVAHHQWGNLLNELGRTDEAERAFRRAVDLHRGSAADRPDDPDDRADLAGSLIAWSGVAARAPAAEEALREAVGLLARLVAEHPRHPRAPDFRLDLGIARQHLARRLSAAGRPAEAERHGREGLRLHEELLAEYPAWPRYRAAAADDLDWLGGLLAVVGRAAEAEQSYRRALDLRRKLVADFPAVPEYRADLADTQINLLAHLSGEDRPPGPDSLPAHRDAVALHESLAARFPALPRHRDRLATSLECLGRAQMAQGRAPEAEQSFRRAAGLFEQLADGHPTALRYRERQAVNLAEVGRLLTWTDRRREAEALFRRAVAIAEAQAAEAPDVPWYRHRLSNHLYSLAVLLRNTGRVAEAGELYDRCLALTERLVAEVPAWADYRLALANTHISRGIVLAAQGRHAEAERGYRRAAEALDKFLADTPGAPQYLSLKAAVLDNLAESLLARGEPAEAKRHVEQAIAHERQALQARPRHPQYLRFLASHYAVLAEADLRLGDHAGAAAAARDLARSFPADDRQLRAAAGLLARCARPAEADGRLSPGERTAAAGAYLDEALALLRQAVMNGYKDAADLWADPHLAPLRHLDEFRRVLAGLERPPQK